MGKVNRRLFNPIELKKGKRPVIIHEGRSSGTTYFTPLDAHEVDGGYVFIVMYSSKSDWVKNTLAAGRARLRVDGSEVDLTNPRLITIDEAAEAFATNTDTSAKLRKKAEYLRVDTSAER
jgi:deazaflavin-dependent oxidoreductase (nitroreductase family)